MIKVIVNPFKNDLQVLCLELSAHIGKVWSVVFIDDYLVSCGDKEDVMHVWDKNEGSLLHDLEGHTGGAISMSV